MGLRHSITNRFLERPFRNLTAEQMAERLELDGRTLERTFAAAKDNQSNRKLLSHISGIERWGQSRLRVALGEPLLWTSTTATVRSARPVGPSCKMPSTARASRPSPWPASSTRQSRTASKCRTTSSAR